MGIVQHIPVLSGAGINEAADDAPTVFSILTPKPGETVIDATLGLGGHAVMFLERTAPDGKLYGLDADHVNLKAAEHRLAAFGERATFVHANFRSIGTLELPHADVIFADLGVSSPHFDDPTRGFSFRADGPLDLRFDLRHGRSAVEFLAHASEKELRHVFRTYGELADAGRFAAFLYKRMRHGGIVATTADLRALVEEAFGFRAPKVLPQVFQALRIAVNDELGALEQFLKDAPRMLRPGGRMGIISYHSLEDRAVKDAFRALATPKLHPDTGAVAVPAKYRLLTKRPIVPSEAEIAMNPRARSAKFRAMEKRSE